MRLCKSCNQEKNIEEFTKRGKLYRHVCKICRNSSRIAVKKQELVKGREIRIEEIKKALRGI